MFIIKNKVYSVELYINFSKEILEKLHSIHFPHQENIKKIFLVVEFHMNEDYSISINNYWISNIIFDNNLFVHFKPSTTYSYNEIVDNNLLDSSMLGILIEDNDFMVKLHSSINEMIFAF